METAFKVKRESELYKKLTENQETMKRALQCLNEISERFGIDHENFGFRYDLAFIGVRGSDRAKFKKSLNKVPDRGLYYFKEKSEVGKVWKQMRQGLKLHKVTLNDIVVYETDHCPWYDFSDDAQNCYIMIDVPIKSYKKDVLEPIDVNEVKKILGI